MQATPGEMKSLRSSADRIALILGTQKVIHGVFLIFTVGTIEMNCLIKAFHYLIAFLAKRNIIRGRF